MALPPGACDWRLREKKLSRGGAGVKVAFRLCAYLCLATGACPPVSLTLAALGPRIGPTRMPPPSSSGSPSAAGMRRVLSASILLAAILFFSWAGLRPPRPEPVNAPPRAFSAERAIRFLGRILTDEQPHPVGSAANDAVRARILAELTNLGYQPLVQTALGCS